MTEQDVRRRAQDRPEREFKVRHLVLGLLGALVVGAGLVTGVGRVAGFNQLERVLDKADLQWLVVCALGQMVVFGGYSRSLRAAIAAEGGPELPTGLALRLVFASFAATQVFAFGGVGGLALTYWALRQLGQEREEAAVRMIGLSTGVYLVFGAVGWLGAVLALVFREAPMGMTVPWIAGFPVVLLLARWFTAPRRVRRWTEHQGTWLRRGLATGIGAAAWVRRRVGRRDARLFGGACWYWIGDIASLWGGLKAVGADPGIIAVVAAYTTGYLVQSLPIPLIATGGVDASTVFLLELLGVPLHSALVGVIAHRIFAFWLPVIPGAVLALTLPAAGSQLSELGGDRPEPGVEGRASPA